MRLIKETCVAGHVIDVSYKIPCGPGRGRIRESEENESHERGCEENKPAKRRKGTCKKIESQFQTERLASSFYICGR